MCCYRAILMRIYKLDKLADFAGPYAQGSGQELSTSGSADLWLENKAGVVMHLTGTQTGATLSLGRDEISPVTSTLDNPPGPITLPTRLNGYFLPPNDKTPLPIVAPPTVFSVSDTVPEGSIHATV
jgi:hypothetical protein